jgi:hypothetical protein
VREIGWDIRRKRYIEVREAYAEQGFTDNTAEYSIGMSEATGRKALSSATALLRQVPKPERAGMTR